VDISLWLNGTHLSSFALDIFAYIAVHYDVCVTLTPAYTTAVFPKRIWWQMFRDVIPRFEPKDFRRMTFYPNSGSEVALRFKFIKDQSEFNTKHTTDMFLQPV
jgi:hypothetical protein